MNTPTSVKISVSAWVAAVAAGALESIVALSEIAGAGGLDAGAWIGLGVRLVVYTLGITMALLLLRGSRVARIGLTVLLSVIGLASLVVPAVLAMADGQTFVEAFGGDGALGGVFLVIRVVHIVLVVLATAAMFSPSANTYLKAQGRLASAAARR